MEHNCDNLRWIQLDDTYDEDFKLKLFKMYKNRPISTPIDSLTVLLYYYPCNHIILCDVDNEPYGGILFWQSEYGNKLSTSFSLNPNIYKLYILPKYIELLNTDGYYAELSEALEYMVRKNGIMNITDPLVIQQVVGINESDIFMEDDVRRNEYKLKDLPSPIGSYLRNIKNVGLERKALYGKPCLTSNFEGTGCNRICISNTNGGKKHKSIIKTKKYKKRNKYKLKQSKHKFNGKHIRK